MILLLCWFMLTITTSSVTLVDEQKYVHENRFKTNDLGVLIYFLSLVDLMQV